MSTQELKRHPVRGALYGVLLGLGLALAAVGQGIVALGTYPPFLILLLGIVAGTAWGMFAPAKSPKGAEPPKPVEILDPNTTA